MRRKYKLPSPWLKWTSPYICLLVRTGKHLVLVDTGAGSLAPTTGQLLRNLRAEKIAPGDIDIVVNTHGHPDHLGGNIGADGKPAFPRARYVMSGTEWDFWTTTQGEQKLTGHSRDILIDIARKNLLPVQDHLDTVEPESEIIPGIKALPAPGHTPGLIVLSISSGNERLLCLSDVVLHPAHLERIDWCSVFDILPEAVAGTRRRLLDMAATEGDLVMAFHFPFPGLGHIIRKGKVWRWQPEETAALA
jgi:glyoxylase-like metal-dependent hydrolase (beta-lactamase superfamily II)